MKTTRQIRTFFGSIVIQMNHLNQPTAVIIDGQQRITTFNFLIALRDLNYKDDDKKI